VTGCSSGIGATLCKFVAEHGHQVVATACKLETLSYLPDSPKVLKLALDVSSKPSVDAALKKTLTTFGTVDVLVDNAG
jgi:NADP-dependent 3-hydroxy acid dehydrogenase YdfG